MGQFIIRQGYSSELREFKHINEFSLRKNSTIRFNEFVESKTEFLRFHYIIDGKFEWSINGENYTLFPTDFAIILPGGELIAQKGYLEIGTFYTLQVSINPSNSRVKTPFGDWCSINSTELMLIKKILFQNSLPVISKWSDAGVIFSLIHTELINQQIGHITRVNHLLDKLIIEITRNLAQHNISSRDFPQTFLKLEEALRNDLSHHWTVEEMAALVGLGTTSFSAKVKNYSGFSPMNYLINIRISEAIKLLKKKEVNMTNIALDLGFYSSQHFATTFKKLTGYTPSEYRKNNFKKD
ncbi:MAG: hypothetical protein RLZZ420_1839 [Bacteroidota bacterium]|jgi:AraC-like DNA-binding protein